MMTSYIHFLEKALDLLDEAVYIYSPLGKAIFMNRKARQMMGVPENSPYRGEALLSVVNVT